MIIVVSCIVIATLAACMMIPFTFSLDTEQHSIISKWFHVKPPTKENVIQNINNFIKNMQNEELEQANTQSP